VLRAQTGTVRRRFQADVHVERRPAHLRRADSRDGAGQHGVWGTRGTSRRGCTAGAVRCAGAQPKRMRANVVGVPACRSAPRRRSGVRHARLYERRTVDLAHIDHSEWGHRHVLLDPRLRLRPHAARRQAESCDDARGWQAHIKYAGTMQCPVCIGAQHECLRELARVSERGGASTEPRGTGASGRVVCSCRARCGVQVLSRARACTAMSRYSIRRARTLRG
jgi:hypothetical protein